MLQMLIGAHEVLKSVILNLYYQESHGLPFPDWVLNGTTYEDIGKVADFGMMWNFNTIEKAKLTGG